MARSGRVKDPEARMRLGQHLAELRRRFYTAAIAIVVLAGVGFFLSDWVLEILAQPLDILEADGRLVSLNITNVTQAFDLKMQIGLMLGLIASSPVWLYEIIAFFMPGLRKNERKYVIGFMAAAIPLFLGGCALGWYVLPRIITVFVGIAPDAVNSLLDATNYYLFALKLVAAVGVGFVLPLIVVMLNFANVITGRAIIKQWRWAIIGITLFTAFVTPAGEMLSMLILAVPMLVLYFGAAGIALINDRRRAKRAARLVGEPA